MLNGIFKPSHTPPEVFTKLALRSKASWGYDEEFMKKAVSSHTVTSSMLRSENFQVAYYDGNIAGFYYLEHEELALLFVDDWCIGRGVGKALFKHAVHTFKNNGISPFVIKADPYSEAFYLSQGAIRVSAFPSRSIPGRMLPLLTYTIS